MNTDEYKIKYKKMERELIELQEKFYEFHSKCPHPEDSIVLEEQFMRASGDSGPQYRSQRWCTLCHSKLGPEIIRHFSWDETR